MDKQEKKNRWVLVKVSDLLVPSASELEELRRRWVGVAVECFMGAGRWQRGKVTEITKRGEVKLAMWCGGAWVPGRVIRFEYIPRVLRRA